MASESVKEICWRCMGTGKLQGEVGRDGAGNSVYGAVSCGSCYGTGEVYATRTVYDRPKKRPKARGGNRTKSHAKEPVKRENDGKSFWDIPVTEDSKKLDKIACFTCLVLGFIIGFKTFLSNEAEPNYTLATVSGIVGAYIGARFYIIITLSIIIVICIKIFA